MKENTPDLLEEFSPDTEFAFASVGTRFANCTVDFLVILLLQAGGRLFLLAVFSELHALPYWSLWLAVLLSAGVDSFIWYFVYYFIAEGFFKGRTVGKRVTGTVALKDDGTPITIMDAVTRSLCRLIPFEGLAALGNGAPLHDRLTNTVVAKK